MAYKIAGIDVHTRVLMVVVMDASTPEEKPDRVRLQQACPHYWLLLGEGHLTRRLFGGMVRRVAALLLPTG